MDLFEAGMTGRRLDEVFIFDAHAHGGTWPGMDRDSSVPGHIDAHLRHMDRIGIDVTCLSGFPSSEGMGPGWNNDIVHEFLSARPDRFKGYCLIDPGYPERMARELERCFDEWDFSGIKIHIYSGHPYDGERYAPMYEFADARRLPVLAHTWGDDWLRQFAAMARRYPEAVFLAAHAGAGDLDITLQEAARTPNLMLELCLSFGTPRLVERLVREVGAGRILWGSDTTLLSPEHQIGKVLFADISGEDKHRILGGNAKRIFMPGET